MKLIAVVTEELARGFAELAEALPDNEVTRFLAGTRVGDVLVSTSPEQESVTCLSQHPLI